MRKFYLIVLTMFLSAGLAAGQNGTIKINAVVNDEQGDPVQYATVVLMTTDSVQSAATTTDAAGRFTCSVRGGEYITVIRCLGYEEFEKGLTVPSDKYEFILNRSSVDIEHIVVRGEYITREADRFILNPSNSPVAVGKNAVELLSSAPGVWYSNNELKINGRSGVKVMINDRLMRMTAEDLEVYMRSISAEDIQRIEIIPISGAEYDADSSSGIIKITLRRGARNGLEGSFSTDYSLQRKNSFNQGATLNLNFRRNGLSIYGGLAGNRGRSYDNLEEYSRYDLSNSNLTSFTEYIQRSKYARGDLGVIYDVNDKHSLGASILWSNWWAGGRTDIRGNLDSPGAYDLETGKYRTKEDKGLTNVAFNYIYKIDTIGSTLKFIADYDDQYPLTRNDYTTSVSSYSDPALLNYTGGRDSLYRNTANGDYHVYTAELALDKKFNDRIGFKTGAKFIYNHFDSRDIYDIYDPAKAEWHRGTEYSLLNDYTERIGAAYLAFNARAGRFSYLAGLRGEYTHARPKTSNIDLDNTAGASQNYLSLFPSAHISWYTNSNESSTLTLGYARTIRRPNYWELMPFRQKISEHTYQKGDPNLKPVYSDELTLTYVLNNKYTATLGTRHRNNGIESISELIDPQSEILELRSVNIGSSWNYYLNLNAPIKITKWLESNLNVYMDRSRKKLYKYEPFRTHSQLGIYANCVATLPLDFIFEVSGRGATREYWGNMEAQGSWYINTALKKRIRDKWTLAMNVNNINRNRDQKIKIRTDNHYSHIVQDQTWNSVRWTFTLHYNFRSGKEVNTRKVQKGGDESRSQ